MITCPFCDGVCTVIMFTFCDDICLCCGQDLRTQWQEFNSSLHGVEDVIRFAEDTMATVTLPADTQAELVEQLDVLRVSCDIVLLLLFLFMLGEGEICYAFLILIRQILSKIFWWVMIYTKF